MSTSSGQIHDTPLNEALGERYLSYALSTIMARSLPDVRDGLKPVQRRILYAMKESGNTHEKSYRKSASAVGYVMMKYHPHGNDPIYEAMVRMAQDFASRYPLVDGQGNFGSLDGDNAAAMRYTEARLSGCASALLEGIDEEAVDFQETYNGETKEPLVLPSSFPNLLANGATGIAVGMATNVPPHNVGEICDALLLLLKKADASVGDLLSLMPGPDFPTGGIIVERPEDILAAYETGRGSIRVRARWEKEELKGGGYQIVVTEIPYQVPKARLMEKLADLWGKKKLPLLSDIRDESTTDVRLILVPRARTVDPQILMESVFRVCDLETRFHLNMNLLDQGRVPRVMSLKEVLQAFLNHRQEVVCRRADHRLAQVIKRLEILEGYLIAYLNLDEVIRIIREEDDPKGVMQAKWDLTDLQVESILNMRLRALRKLEEIEIRKEHDGLSQEKSDLEIFLKDTALQWKRVGTEIKEVQKRFGVSQPFGKRRTSFEDKPEVDVLPLEAFVEREAVTVVCSQNGWIRTLKGHNPQEADLKYKEGDKGRFVIKAENVDKLVLFATNGRFYTLGIDKLPGGRGQGEPLRLMLDMDPKDEVLDLFIVTQEMLKEDKKLLVASSDGRGFVVALKDVMAHTKGGKQILNVQGKVKAQKCVWIEGDGIAMIGQNRKLLIFKVDEIPQMSRGKGVLLQRYREGRLGDIKSLRLEDGLSWKSGERTRLEQDIRAWLGRRGQSGRMPPVGFPRTNTFD
ncbi:MAG: DNA topoisomerase IV subunit A [Alphaproteobacteria bacterium]|jgi:topoisomerase-4 subunit A|nr:DNA topoisomerase IV subunit A [Alphaproteobacteria bacterium]